MTFKRILAALSGLGVVIAVIAIGASQAIATSGGGALAAKAATVQPAQLVNASSPATGFAPSAPSTPALGRDGKPAGSELPTHPSSGAKPGAAKTPSGPTPRVVTTNAFNGIDVATSDCGCQPPDVNATVGPNHIVETVNLEYAVYNKAGTLLLRESFNNFLGTNDGLSDPRVLYDPTWDRWAISIIDTSNASIWTAYSTSGDPTGGFYVYHFSLGLNVTLYDYPNTGQDANSFVYTTNNFNGNSYVNTTTWIFQKARVYNGFGFGFPYYFVNYNTTPSIVGGHPTEQGNFLYMLSPDDANNLMYVYHWANTGGVPTAYYDGSIAYNWAAPPRQVNQPGTSQTLDPLDGRLVWANTQIAGRIWFAHGVAIGSFPGVDYGFVTPGNMTIQTAQAFHSGSSDDFNPSISTQIYNGVAQAWLNWAYTDTPNNVPTRDVYDLNQGNTLSYHAGTVYSGPGNSTGEFRFGDYSSSWPEYNAVGGCAEGLNAVVANQFFEANGNWGTRIARVHRSGC